MWDHAHILFDIWEKIYVLYWPILDVTKGITLSVYTEVNSSTEIHQHHWVIFHAEKSNFPIVCNTFVFILNIAYPLAADDDETKLNDLVTRALRFNNESEVLSDKLTQWQWDGE